MATTMRRMGTTAVLTVSGKLLLGDAVDQFRAAWSDALASGARAVIVNLSAVPMVDSSGIGSLIRCHSAVTGNGGKLMVVGISDVVLQALRVTHLDRVLQIYQDESLALSALSVASS